MDREETHERTGKQARKNKTKLGRLDEQARMTKKEGQGNERGKRHGTGKGADRREEQENRNKKKSMKGQGQARTMKKKEN